MPSDNKFGATGEFTRGMLNPDDEGELNFGVASDPIEGLVHVKFGTPVAWLALPASDARQFAAFLLKHADLADKKPGAPKNSLACFGACP